jgi:hypothetical protein
MPLAYVAWRASTTYGVVVPVRQAGNRFLGSIKGLQIRAQASDLQIIVHFVVFQLYRSHNRTLEPKRGLSSFFLYCFIVLKQGNG